MSLRTESMLHKKMSAGVGSSPLFSFDPSSFLSAPPHPRTHLCLPDGVHSVASDRGSPLLPMMREGWKDAVFPRLNGNLQIRVWVEKHPLLQPHGLEIYQINDILFKYILVSLSTYKSYTRPDNSKH